MLGQSFFGQHQQPNHLAELRYSIQKNIDLRLKAQQTNETTLQSVMDITGNHYRFP